MTWLRMVEYQMPIILWKISIFITYKNVINSDHFWYAYGGLFPIFKWKIWSPKRNVKCFHKNCGHWSSCGRLSTKTVITCPLWECGHSSMWSLVHKPINLHMCCRRQRIYFSHLIITRTLNATKGWGNLPLSIYKAFWLFTKSDQIIMRQKIA